MFPEAFHISAKSCPLDAGRTQTNPLALLSDEDEVRPEAIVVVVVVAAAVPEEQGLRPFDRRDWMLQLVYGHWRRLRRPKEAAAKAFPESDTKPDHLVQYKRHKQSTIHAVPVKTKNPSPVVRVRLPSTVRVRLPQCGNNN